MPESLKEDGRPAQQWYWDDWFSEFGLRLCSLEARGLWIDMLGIMWSAEIRGTLTVNGRQLDSKSLAKLCNEPVTKINACLVELERNEVYSRLSDETIISRRLFRESKKQDHISKIRSIAGQEGAKKRWQKDSKGDNKKITKMAAPSSSPTSTSTPSSKEKKDFAIPNWIPRIEFEEYKKMRQKIKKPMTDRAVELVIKKLEQLKIEGYEPKEVLEQSILNSWQGIFPLKNNRSEYQPSRIGESRKKPTDEKEKYYEERQKKQIEVQTKYKKEIDKIRKKGDKIAGEALQEKIDNEVAEWSREYLENSDV